MWSVVQICLISKNSSIESEKDLPNDTGLVSKHEESGCEDEAGRYLQKCGNNPPNRLNPRYLGSTSDLSWSWLFVNIFVFIVISEAGDIDLVPTIVGRPDRLYSPQKFFNDADACSDDSSVFYVLFTGTQLYLFEIVGWCCFVFGGRKIYKYKNFEKFQK